MSVLVLTPGLHSLLVDRGRPAARKLGLPLGGAADQTAYQLANALVGNPPSMAALELTLVGPKLKFLQPVGCVIFGADLSLQSNRQQREVGKSFTAEPNEELTFGGMRSGARAYLAVVGGFHSELVLGSRSAFGPVQADELLRCSVSSVSSRRLTLDTSSPNRGELRVLPGPQRDWFDDAFFQQSYTVSPSSNRMGLRLQGVPLQRRAGELTSEAVAPGAVQIANDGQPIVLGVDGQTIGGYPKVAHVIAADLDRLAQLRPHAELHFRLVTLEEANSAYRERRRNLQEWLTRLAVTSS